MQLILKRPWEAIDARKGKSGKTIIPPGTHEIERMPNLLGHSGHWLVLKGTFIGAAEDFWRQWNGPEWDDYEVIVVD